MTLARYMRSSSFLMRDSASSQRSKFVIFSMTIGETELMTVTTAGTTAPPSSSACAPTGETTDERTRIKPNQIKSNHSNQIKSNQIKSSKPNQIEPFNSNQIKPMERNKKREWSRVHTTTQG